jgi:hypothetical protein
MTARLLTAVAAVAVVCVSSVDADGRRQTRETPIEPTVGTGEISGVIVTAEPQPRPVRRVVVTLTGSELRPKRGAITDDEGRFSIGGLPAGRFTLTATRAGFVTSVYGAKRPARPGTPVVVSDGGSVTGLVVTLWRGAAVAGVLRDETGAPVEGVAVTAVPARRRSSNELLTLSNNGVTTNDQGEYRIFGLEPGSYVIRAEPASSPQPSVELGDARIDAALAALARGAPGGAGTALRLPAADVAAPKPFVRAPVYYPGTAVLARAVPVQLEAGAEITSLDIRLDRVPTVVVEGAILRADGGPLAGAAAQLTEDQPAGAFADLPPDPITTTSGPDGTFRFTQVTPGNYRLLIRAPIGELDRSGSNPTGQIRPGFVARTQWAMADVSVAGGDVSGLALTLQPPLTLAGRVVFESDSKPPPEKLAALQVALFPPGLLDAPRGTSIRTIATARPVAVQENATFALEDIVPGTYEFTVVGGPIADASWWPRSAMLDGRDLLDGRVEIDPGMNLAGVVITLSDRRTALTGTLQTTAGTPASDVFVVAFSEDEAYWGPAARRVEGVRPDSDGRYAIRDLPPGRYRLAAVLDADENDWYDSAFLKLLLPASIAFTLGEGEQRVQDLQVGRDAP